MLIPKKKKKCQHKWWEFDIGGWFIKLLSRKRKESRSNTMKYVDWVTLKIIVMFAITVIGIPVISLWVAVGNLL